MIRRPPRSTRTDTLFPYTTLFRSQVARRHIGDRNIVAYPVLRHVDIGRQRRAAETAQIERQDDVLGGAHEIGERSEEHTSELQSLMRISYAVFCLKKKKNNQQIQHKQQQQETTTNQKKILNT